MDNESQHKHHKLGRMHRVIGGSQLGLLEFSQAEGGQRIRKKSPLEGEVDRLQ